MQTGATIFRVAAPLMLDHTAPRFDSRLDEWILLAPLEINRAGNYRLFLWVELPVEHNGLALVLDVDGQPMELVLATKNRRSIAVGKDVYADQSAFGYSGYYHLSEAQLLRLADSGNIRVNVKGIEGAFETEDPQLAIRETFRQIAQLN